jgi:photosystem II stability/assembly factor-like uncharacterized protein
MRIARCTVTLPLLVLALAQTACAVPLAAPAQEGAHETTAAKAPAGFDAAWFGGLKWREIGPYRGGRSAAVTGVPSQPDVYWFGACGGGVWKTVDGGRTWTSASDGTFGGSIGAVAVSEWDPNVVYAGGGEKTVRGNVSHGDGVWKSTDAGKTWKHVGLADSRHVPRLRIHPRDPELVYAAVLGHLFGPNEERGVYRTRDGGATWERVLFVSPDAGCVDLALDPTNPRVLYACLWNVRRKPWALESGGPGSGLWKSTDGGDTWTDLTAKPGLPAGTWGISGICVSPSAPDSLYAIVENEKGGVFRSRDGGEHWERTNEKRELRQRAWYYTRIYADPADAEGVYVVNVDFHRSKDGGRTFSTIDTPHGDNHDLWIAPDDPARMIQANDGGVNVSRDGGATWTAQSSQPTAQMYRVSTDDDFPYRLLGGQQDNSAVRIRSRSLESGSIGPRDWEPTAGGESGHVVATPNHPDIVFGGSYGGDLERLDHQTGDARAVDVWPDDPMGGGAGAARHRFQWNFPLFFSPHAPHELYAAAEVLFASGDGGASWRAISPDLTRGDESKLGASGGAITKDNTGVEYYATIFAAAESPLEKGVLWTGSDDGLVHVSRDGGKQWNAVTPPELPEWSQVNSLEPSPFEAGGCYLAATRYKLDELEPYLFKTADWGRTWTRIDSGIDRSHFTRVVRADPVRRGLLYAGTERGVWVSFDDGGAWSALQLDLPIVPITDLAVKEDDLVAATQGRGYWILDDLSPLRQLDAAAQQGAVHLFEPRPTPRVRAGRSEKPGHAGTNPEPGVLFSYMLPDGLAADAALELEIQTADGAAIRKFERKPAEGVEPEKLEPHAVDDPRRLPSAKGLNRFAWDLSYPSAEKFEGMVLWNERLSGPRALPGSYRAVLRVGEERREVTFEVAPDPRSTATAQDLQRQFDFLLAGRDELTRVHRAIRRVREARGQVTAIQPRLPKDSEAARLAESLLAELKAPEEALYQTRNESPQDPLNFPIRLNDKLADVLGKAERGDWAPTAQMVEVRALLSTAIEAELAKLERVWSESLPAFNAAVKALDLPAVAEEPASGGNTQAGSSSSEPPPK